MKIHIFALRWKDEIRRSSQLRLDIKVNMFITKLRVWKQSEENSENLSQSSIKLLPVGVKEFNLFQINDLHHDHCTS